jgi:nucleoside-diphosphate-sugar epimerase
MRILISGSKGFVGKNLTTYLSKHGYMDVRELDLRGDWVPQVHDNASAIIHLAGKAHDLKNVSDPEEYYRVNFQLTKSLYNEFLQSNAKLFIFISSVKAAADSIEKILKESFVPIPETHYGKSKLMAEEYIQQTSLPTEKSFVILRPCMIHGPGNKGNLNLLYQFVKRGIPYPLAAFSNKRSYLSVHNLCFIIDKLLKKDKVVSGIYNVADDKSLSTTEVFSILSRSLNKSAVLWNIPIKVIEFAAYVGDKLHLPLNTERLSKLTENFEVSNSKIKAELKIELPIDSSDGILLTANSFHLLPEEDKVAS